MLKHPIFRFSLLIPTVTAFVMLVFWLTALASNAQAEQPPPISQGSAIVFTDTITTTVYLPLTPRGFGGPCVFQESGGLIVIEIESVSPVDQWIEENNIPGFLGESYYTWRGPDHYGTPGVGLLSFPISVTTPGLYDLRFHNYHGHPDHSLENDAFVQMDGSGWVKAFSGIGQTWNWALAFDYGNHVLGPAEYYLSPGQHLFQISARSANFSIDRIVFFVGGVNGTDPGWPESSCAYVQ